MKHAVGNRIDLSFSGALPFVVLGFLVGFVPPGRAGDKAADTARDAMTRGLDWLKAAQHDDGSWSNPNFPAMTALGLWAFAQSDHPARTDVCARAAAFIEGLVQEDGGIYKPASLGMRSGGLSTYNTAICMTALHACDKTRYASVILKARKFMAESQLVGDSAGAGGFSYDRNPPLLMKVAGAITGRGNRADLSNTGWAVQAMRVTQDIEDLRPGGETVDIDWQAVRDFVSKLQNTDENDPVNHGGFGYESGGARGGTTADSKDGTVTLRGYGSMTYAGLESMIYAQVGLGDPRVRSAIEWAGRHWSVDENPGMGTRGHFYYLNIMAKALSLTGTPALAGSDGNAIPWRDQLIAKLVGMQGDDGSWKNPDNSFWEADPVLVTCYAILALQYAAGM